MTAPILELGARQPFTRSALEYSDKGWHPFPLPPGQKSPPPVGSTGGKSAMVKRAQVEQWLVDPAIDPRSNIGIRMPYHIIGIDVDCYAAKQGGKTLADLEEKLGPLPATWALTARADGVSGIRMFRIPKGQSWPGDLGADIEIIQWGHRYAVTYPARHPDLNNKIYHWYRPGQPLNGKSHSKDYIPDVREPSEELPDGGADWGTFAELPQEWIEALSKGEFIERSRVKVKGFAGYKRWASTLPEPLGEPCRQMARALKVGLDNLLESSGGAAHTELNTRVYELLGLAVEGHRGVRTAINALGKAFLEEVAERRQAAALAGKPAGTVRSEEEATREVHRELIGATALFAGEEVYAACSCWDEPVVGMTIDGEPIYASTGRANDPGTYDADDIGNAQHFVDLADGGLVWVPETLEWRGFDPDTGLWRSDGADRAGKLALILAGRVRTALDQKYIALSAARASQSEEANDDADIIEREIAKLQENLRRHVAPIGGRRAFIDTAKMYDEMVAHGASFDANPNTLLCGDGQVIELLKDGINVRIPTREDRFTVATKARFDQGASHPAWSGPHGFLDTFLPDPELRRYVQCLFGYSLLGANPERRLVFLHGPTSTGKSTLVESVMSAMGSYASTFDLSMFREKSDPGAPRVDIATKLNRRFLFSSEASSATHLHNDSIKRMVGGDTLGARLNHANAYVEGVAAFTPFVATNEFPTITDADPAYLSQRLVAVPFDTQVVGKAAKAAGRVEDVTARDTLRQDPDALAAVLAWLVEGYVLYAQNPGYLNRMPEVVKARTQQAAMASSDFLEWFMLRVDVTTKRAKENWVKVDVLYNAYLNHMAEAGANQREILSGIQFAKALSRHGVAKTTVRRFGSETHRVRKGLRLLGRDGQESKDGDGE